jgi:rRNA maturation RNase YbeY
MAAGSGMVSRGHQPVKASAERQNASQSQAQTPTVQRNRLCVLNRQRTRAVDVSALRRLLRSLLSDLLDIEEANVGLYLVGAPEISRLNETFLRHAGATDVITFDYLNNAAVAGASARKLHGEIFVCVSEAVAQARRFRATWQSEVLRYIVHGVLHLQGHTDTRPAARRRMKAVENRLMRRLAVEFTPGPSQRGTGA